MKVVYVLNIFPKISETFILNEMLAVRKKGVDVEVLAFKSEGESLVHPGVKTLGETGYFAKPTFWGNLRAHSYWAWRHPFRYARVWGRVLLCGNGLRKFFFLELEHTVRVAERRPDHIHAHFGNYASDMSLLTHLLSGIPFSFTTHSYDLFDGTVQNFRFKSKKAKKHIVISRYNQTHLREQFGVDPSWTELIHCGIDFEAIPQRSADAPGGAPLILSVGRLGREKGFDILIKACALLKERGISYECVIVGEGKERPALEKQIAESGLQERVRLVGNQTHPQVFEWLRKATVKVLASRLEGIPVSLMEAMALGVPVISTAIYGIPELIEDGVSGFLVPPEDETRLAARLTELLGNRSLQDTFAREGARKVRQDFDLKKETDKLTALWFPARNAEMVAQRPEAAAVPQKKGLMKRQILVNLGSNYLLSLSGMVLGFMLVPFLIRRLGKDAYGLTVLAEATVGFFEILTISIRMALSRYSTFSLSQEKFDDFVEYLSTGRVLLYFTATIVFAFTVFLSMNFNQVFQVPAALVRDSQGLSFLIGLAITISIPNIIFWSVLYARQRFDLINLSSSLGMVVRVVCLFVFFSFAPARYQSLTAYGLIYLVMTFSQNFLIYRWHWKLMPAGKFIAAKFFRLDRVREILSYSFHTSISRVSELLRQETSHVIVNVLWGPVFNTIYSVSLKLPNMMSRVFVEPGWALTPTFTDLAARGEKDRIGQLLYMYSKALSIVVLPICFILTLFARPMIASWVGPDFDMAGKLLTVFSVALIIHIPFSLSGSLLSAYGKVKVPSIVSLAVSVISVGLCLLLGQVFGMKLFGIAITALMTTLCLSTFFLPTYACRVSGLSLWRYWKESFLKPLSVSCVFIGGGYWFLGLSRFTNIFDIGLIIALIVLTLVCYLSSYLFLLHTDEKEHIHQFLRPIFIKLGFLAESEHSL